jgi:hypothetical protein
MASSIHQPFATFSNTVRVKVIDLICGFSHASMRKATLLMVTLALLALQI